MIDSGTLLQGRFLIEDKIGSGGMGAVYRAVDQKFGTLVAIKETFYGDTELAEAFKREARLLNGLHHPILPHVSDSFTENGGHFLVMEFIEGEDLSEILKRGELLPVDTVLGWTLDILDGLDYLHSQVPPVVHRDIKPNNLKLTSRGKIVLLDFGMAKDTTGNTIGAKSVFGYSRRYSPLEQIEGTGTDSRSDIFSLGASIYHLLTGQPPADALARASAIVGGRPDPLVAANSLNPNVPGSVAAILNSALALNTDNRLASAGEMSRQLRPALETIGYESVTSSAATIPASGMPLAATAADAGYFDPITSVRPTEESSAAASSTSIPPIRIRRPSRLRYAAALPLVLLCLGLVLFGTYRGLQGGVGDADVAAEPTANTSAEEISDVVLDLPELETPIAVESDQQAASKTGKAEAETVSTKSEIETARKTGAAPKQDKENVPEANPARSNVRREQVRTSNGDTRPRKVVKPAFKQPAVSSIEAIMTGVPYERRTRSDDERWNDEEARRRRIRQMRREQRRQQPY